MPDPFASSSSPPAVPEVGFVEHDEGSFRCAFNLFHFPHRELGPRARSSVEWAFLEFTDHSAHRPADWPNDVETLDPTDAMTAVEYLDKLIALLTQLIDESTDLASTLRYHRARAELLAGCVGGAIVDPGSGDVADDQPGVS